MKKLLLSAAATLALVSASASIAQEPARDISQQRHGNLAAAQDLTRQAYDKLTAAQQANESDLGGHAAKAKELLRQASDEMKLAAEAANRR